MSNDTKIRCSFCGIALNTKNVKPVLALHWSAESEQETKEHYFCSESCEEVFNNGYSLSED